MKPRICTIFILGLSGILASEVWAKPPSPGDSDVPRWIRVVGTGNTSGRCIPDPSGTFTATVRGFTNTPEPGVDVEMNFQNCSEVKLCQAVVAGQTFDCA